MQKNEDGSVTLTKQEFNELHGSYQKLADILDRMPMFLGDYCEEQEEYISIRKWEALLAGEKFDRKDWE